MPTILDPIALQSQKSECALVRLLVAPERVRVDALGDGHVIGEQLQWDDSQQQ